MGSSFGRRSARSVLAAPLRARNYRLLGAASRRFPTPARELWRYLTYRGSYPYRCRIRTPLGEIAPTLYGPDDMITVQEIFGAGVYPVDRDAASIVDFGANIGISALYFLTEAPRARLHLYEANPALSERLRANIGGFEDRASFEAVAVATADGSVDFGVEPSGRYGGIVVNTSESVEVRCRSAASILAEVIAATGPIDLLKIDIEGTEIELLGSLPTELLAQVRAIYVETAVGQNPLPGLFEMEREGVISRLISRASS